mgnify:CR=1 FL=1
MVWDSLFSLRINLISNPPYRLDEPGPAGRLFELIAKTADVGHDRVVVIQIFFPPYGLEKLLRGNHAALMFA